jgi:hypothetical protein
MSTLILQNDINVTSDVRRRTTTLKMVVTVQCHGTPRVTPGFIHYQHLQLSLDNLGQLSLCIRNVNQRVFSVSHGRALTCRCEKWSLLVHETVQVVPGDPDNSTSKSADSDIVPLEISLKRVQP